MYVQKRDGRREPVSFDKITSRIERLSYGLNPDFCDPVSWTSKGLQVPPGAPPGPPEFELRALRASNGALGAAPVSGAGRWPPPEG